jgi:PAS domain S-box-containing protein
MKKFGIRTMNGKVTSKKSDHHAQFVLNSIAEGVFTVNKEMIITQFNKSAERITCVPVENALGKYCFDVFRSDICETECPLKRSIDTGRSIIDQRNKILRADSREIPISLSTAVIIDDSGDVIGGVETFRDLSGLESLKKEIFNENSFNDNSSENQKIFESSNNIQLAEKSISSALINDKDAAPELPLLKNAEKYTIVEVLKKNRWNMMKTAEELGIDRTTLWRKMKKFNISKS